MKLIKVFTVAAASLFFLPSAIYAQEQEPMIFMTSAAQTGASATLAATLEAGLEEALGRDVEYRFQQGRNAGVGVEPDGNTMLISTIGTLSLGPVLIDGYTLDATTDLRPITQLTAYPDFLLVRPNMGVSTLEELIEYANESEKPLTYWHIAPTSIHRVEFGAIFHEFGIDNVVLDSSNGNGPIGAIEAMGNDELDLLVITSRYTVPMVEEGAAIPVAVIHPTRVPLYPEVPTLLEKGVTTMPNGSWAGIFVPAGTSDEDAQEVYDAIKHAVSDEAVVAQINSLGMEVVLSDSPDDFTQYLLSESSRLKIAVDKYQITTD